MRPLQAAPPSAERRRALAAAWAACLGLYVAFAVWLASHPPALPSDDALFFARGLSRFSVLDFAPQFPGYPGFIALAHLILPFASGPTAALFCLTVAIALAIPPAAAAVAWRISRRADIALACFAITLGTPLLPDLGLSLLSDGAGILFLLVFLALMPAHKDQSQRPSISWLAGAALGWALCCRPSDAALFAGAFLAVAWRLPRATPRMLGGALIVGLPTFAALYAHEGALYFWEARQFLTGHTLGWGHTPFSAGARESWYGAIAAVPAGRAIAALTLAAAWLTLVRTRRVPPALAAAGWAFAAHLAWIILMQNPYHLRHLAPLAVLGGLMVAMTPASERVRAVAVALALAFNVPTLVGAMDFDADRLPPIARAANFLSSAPAGSAVALNDGVALLRTLLPAFHVYDMQAPADARYGLETTAGKAFRLSTTPLGPAPAARFSGRCLGEKTVYAYRWPLGGNPLLEAD